MTLVSDQVLRCHRATPGAPLTGITAAVRRLRGNRLALRFTLCGDSRRLRLPRPRAARHTDGLWQHTCLEAFIASADAPAYHEINLSPSGAWAVYGFDGYRRGMRAVTPREAPVITLDVTPEAITLTARLRLAELPAGALRIGLSAVIEDRAGNRTYWALRHPRARPDFHHRGGFALLLPAATGDTQP